VQPFFFERECKPWELALAHAVAATSLPRPVRPRRMLDTIGKLSAWLRRCPTPGTAGSWTPRCASSLDRLRPEPSGQPAVPAVFANTRAARLTPACCRPSRPVARKTWPYR
jgi:hypothetical protein